MINRNKKAKNQFIFVNQFSLCSILICLFILSSCTKEEPIESATKIYRFYNNTSRNIVIQARGESTYTQEIILKTEDSKNINIDVPINIETHSSPFKLADRVDINYGDDLTLSHFPDEMDMPNNITQNENWQAVEDISSMHTYTFSDEDYAYALMNADIDYDTIFPESYYPIYPSSWWKYSVNDSIISTIHSSEDYVLNFFRSSQNQSWIPHEYSDPKFVPLLEGEPIYGYWKVDHIQPPFGDYYKLWPFLSEEVGYEYVRGWTDGRYGDYNEHLIIKDKYLSGMDSILLVEGHWVSGIYTSWKSYQKYIKGVGLDTYYVIDTLEMDTLYSKILMDYYIND